MSELYDFLLKIVMVYPLIILDSLIITLIIIRGFTVDRREKRILKCLSCLLQLTDHKDVLASKNPEV